MLNGILERSAKYVKTSALALPLVFSLAGTGHAQSVEWRGFVVLDGSGSNCEQYGWGGINTGQARFRPSDLGSNGSETRLSMFLGTFAIIFSREGRFDRRWRPVASTVVSSYTRAIDTIQVRVTSQTPRDAALTADTPQIYLVGQIQNMEGAAGCNPTFTATLLRRTW
ncbi:MAG: hypothetical protein H6898_15645 [Rhodobacter sp.]|nr:hypothetical protein [Rhodobacter sp.]